MSETTGTKRSRDEMSQDDTSNSAPPTKKVVVAGDTAPGVAPPAEKEAVNKMEGNGNVGVATVNGSQAPATQQVPAQNSGIINTQPSQPQRQLSENTRSLMTSENLSNGGVVQNPAQVAQNPSFMDTAIGVSIPPREVAANLGAANNANAPGVSQSQMQQLQQIQMQQIQMQQMQMQQRQQLLAQSHTQLQGQTQPQMAGMGMQNNLNQPGMVGGVPSVNGAMVNKQAVATAQQRQMQKVQQQKKMPQKLKVEDALAYLAKVKAEFDRKPHIYTKFLDIMKNFKAHTVDTPGVIQQVSQLFRGHDQLILGFNTFLPEEQRISLEQLKRMNKQEEEKKKQRKKAAAQRKAKKEREKKRNEKAAQDAKRKQKGGAGAGGPQPFGFDHAISYVTKIKRRFAERPATYREFLDILHLYKEQEQSIEGVLDSVSELFKNEPDLLREFAYFLPEAVQEQAKARLNLAVNSYRGQGKKGKKGKGKGKQEKVKNTKIATSEKKSKVKVVLREEKKEEKKMVLLEKRFFKRIKAALGQQNLWMEFLKCLELYSREVLNKNEFLSLVSDILGALPGDEGEKYTDELEAVLDKRLTKAELEDETWLSMPASEIDLSHARRSTPSYRCLPKNYPRPTCSMRTALCDSVLNNQWISVPTSSEENTGFKNLRRNVFEEKLFKCEDDRYEIDMVMDANRAAIRRLIPINEEIQRLQSSGQQLYQFRLDKRALGVIHLKAIGRVYGDHGNEVLELLRKNPAGAVPVILARLQEKALEWGNSLKSLNEKWKAVLEDNYQKSLDHRSYYFKAQERKAIMAKTLLQEIKVCKDRLKLTPAKNPNAMNGNDGSFPSINNSNNKVDRTGTTAIVNGSATTDNSGSGSSTTTTTTTATNAIAGGNVDTGSDELKRLHKLKTDPHILHAYPDIEAHQDAFKIVLHAATNGPEALNKDDIAAFENVFSSTISSFFGLPEGFASIQTIKASKVAVKAKKALAVGTEVFTPFGKGKVKAFHSGETNTLAQCYVVELPVGDAFLAPVNVSASTDLSVATSGLSLQMFVGNELYLFFRLYQMLYARLRKAKELCRNSSTLQKSQVKHYLDRSKYPSTPRSLSNDGMSSPRASDAMDVDGSPKRRLSESPFVPLASPSNAAEAAATQKKVQLQSRTLYYDFLQSLYKFLDESTDQQSFEDRCRELMGASTASYMMFTLDKLVRNLVRHANEIVNSEVCSCMLELHQYEMAASAIVRKRYLGNSAYILNGDPNENLFLVSSEGGKLANSPPKGGTHVPGVWQESLPWERVPSMGFELIGAATTLRSEKVANPSDWNRDVYISQYMLCSSLNTFDIAPDPPSGILLPKNKRMVQRYLDADSSNADGGKKDGRDRRARERASSNRNAHAWGLGKIHVSDQLVSKISLKDYKFKYVSGSEDFFYRIYPESLIEDDDEDESSSSESESDNSDSDSKSSKDSKDSKSKKMSVRDENKLKIQRWCVSREEKFANWAKVVSDELLEGEETFKEVEKQRLAAAKSLKQAEEAKAAAAVTAAVTATTTGEAVVEKMDVEKDNSNDNNNDNNKTVSNGNNDNNNNNDNNETQQAAVIEN
jgi:histone deacetylase complex regulatory component SIN3